MRERTITLFVEDFAHQQVIGPLVLRLAAEHGAAVRLDWRSAVRGHGAVVRELGGYLRNLSHGADRGRICSSWRPTRTANH